ncbi:MAG: sulfotransferase [Bacteroidales bacterium]|nr:sulfotransferase [Bacteroidales bacterium]
MIQQFYNTYKYHLYSLNPFLNYPKKKFVIVSMGRTGSTLLASLLNRHSRIYCDSEIFMRQKHKKLYFPLMYIKGHYHKLKAKDIYGFKVKEEQFSTENKIDSNRFLHSLVNDNWKVIRLVRKNRLKLALSIYIAWEDGVYEVKREQKFEKKKQVFVHLNRFKQILDFHDKIIQREDKALKNIDYLKLSYETDLVNEQEHQKTANKVFSYLGIKKQEVETNFVKKSEDDMKVLVSNYDEFENFFSKTKYKQFLFD